MYYFVTQEDDSWEMEACNKVDDLLESFMGIRDTELGMYVSVHLWCMQIDTSVYQNTLDYVS